MPFDSLWEDRDAVSVLGTRINVPGAEQMLLMLCVHWASHCWASLKWACDIAAFLHLYPQLDWTRVCNLARRRGCLRMLLLAVELARDVTDVTVPDPVSSKIRSDAVITHLCREVRQRSFTTDGLLYDQRLMSYFKTRDGILDKIRFGIRHFRSLVALRTRLRRLASKRLLVLEWLAYKGLRINQLESTLGVRSTVPSVLPSTAGFERN